MAQCENIMVDKDSFEPNPIGMLDAGAIRELVKSLGHVIDSDCEPN